MIGYGGQVGYRKLIASDLYNKIADNDIRKNGSVIIQNII